MKTMLIFEVKNWLGGENFDHAIITSFMTKSGETLDRKVTTSQVEELVMLLNDLVSSEVFPDAWMEEVVMSDNIGLIIEKSGEDEDD